MPSCFNQAYRAVENLNHTRRIGVHILVVLYPNVKWALLQQQLKKATDQSKVSIAAFSTTLHDFALKNMGPHTPYILEVEQYSTFLKHHNKCRPLCPGGYEKNTQTQEESQPRVRKLRRKNPGETMVVWTETERRKVVPMDTAKTEARLKHLRKMHATVIPAPRKLVKRMVSDAIADVLASLCSSEERSPKNSLNNDDGRIQIKPGIGAP